MATKSSDWRPGPTVCRCCFAEGCYKDISTEYFWMGKREVYCEMLTETFDVTIAYSQAGGPNSNSRLICEPCISRLRDASDFKRQVVECEKTFMHHLDPGSSSVLEMDVHVEPADKEVVKLERVKLEAKLSDDDFDPGDDGGFPDDDDDDLDDEPLTKLASKVPKKESVDIMDLLDNSKAEKRKSTTKVKSSPAKKPKKKESPKPSASKQPAKAEKKKRGEELSAAKSEPSKSTKAVQNRNNLHQVIVTDTIESKLRKNSAIALLFNTTLSPFKWTSKYGNKKFYMCIYCSEHYAKIEELTYHYMDKHGQLTKAEITKSIYKMSSFYFCKVNVTDAKCKLCDDDIANFTDLKKHVLNKHNEIDVNLTHDGLLPFNIKNEEFRCAICNIALNTFVNMNKHMNTHYNNFVCDQCGVGYASPDKLRSHIRFHGTGQFPCDICGKVFRNIDVKKDHYAIVHMNAKKNLCPYCPEKFKNYSQKKNHMMNVHDLKVETFKCDLCPKTFLLKGQIPTHKREVHEKSKRFACDICDWKFYFKCQLKNHMACHGDKKYECKVCKKCFARGKTLKEHMRIHNNDRRFICDVCNSAFVQKCSLKSHIITRHKLIKKQ